MTNSKWAALGVALLASTSLTTGASAAEWSATVTGGAEVGIAYVDVDDAGARSASIDIQGALDDIFENCSDFEDTACIEEAVEANSDEGGEGVEEIGLVNDAEVQFKFKLVADNGLTFGYNMELENDDDGAFDEYVAYVKGSFGEVQLGHQDGAHDAMLLTPPGCSFSCPGDGDGYLFDHFSDVSNVSIDGDGTETSDDLKISYFTPSFSGFKAGISFIPDGASTGAEGTNATDLTSDDASAWEFGARWQGDITDEFDAGISIGYTTGDERSGLSDEDSLAIAGEVGAFGGAFGVRWAENASDDQALSIGAEYGTGPWGFFVNWAQTIDSDDDAKDGDWGVSLEADYDIAPGVTGALIVEFAEDGGDGECDGSDCDSEFAIGTSLGLSF